MYLFTANLKTKKPSKKLNHVKFRPFFIAEEKKLVNYRLQLLKDTKIHPIFYISLLELADSNTLISDHFLLQTLRGQQVQS